MEKSKAQNLRYHLMVNVSIIKGRLEGKTFEEAEAYQNPGIWNEMEGLDDEMLKEYKEKHANIEHDIKTMTDEELIKKYQ